MNPYASTTVVCFATNNPELRCSFFSFFFNALLIFLFNSSSFYFLISHLVNTRVRIVVPNSWDLFVKKVEEELMLKCYIKAIFKDGFV